MNIEEAIGILKDNIKSLEGHTPFKHTNYKKVQAIETLLTAYEKQSKEIEELKQNIHLKEVYVLKTNDYIKGTNIEDELCNKKWEDKIKAKIEWLDKEGYFEFLSNRDILKCHNILASLLEKE